jgi:hypothetical protein
MYTSLWVKYLPVIRILLKKSLKEDQIFLMNIPDFDRAGLKRKSALKFLMKLKNGRPGNVIVDFPLASSLATVLQLDAAIQDLLAANEFIISLNTKYELSITHVPQPEAELKPVAVADEAE